METPRSFDWVKARSNCTPAMLFEHLSEVVQANTTSYENNMAARTERRFEFRQENGRFWVSGSRAGEPFAGVSFQRCANDIKVKKGKQGEMLTPYFTVKPFIMDGCCKLKIDNEPQALELWQVSQRALEDLFFS